MSQAKWRAGSDRLFNTKEKIQAASEPCLQSREQLSLIKPLCKSLMRTAWGRLKRFLRIAEQEKPKIAKQLIRLHQHG